MDEGETVSKPDRKELRKQKLMEYLAAKGTLKPFNPKPYLRDIARVSSKVHTNKGKENQGPNAVKVKKEGGKAQPGSGRDGSQATLKTTRANDNNQKSGKAPRTPTFTTASLTTRINALKSISLSVGQRPPTNQKRAPTGKNTTSAIERHSQAASQPRAKIIKSSATLAHVCHEQVLAGMKSRKSHPSSGMQASTLRSPRTRSSTAAGVRMSIGTVAQTKTGLIPTVTQPRNTNPQASVSVPNASIRPRVPSRGHSDSCPSASISQKASVMQRKALPVRTVGQSVDGKECRSHVSCQTESRFVTARPQPGGQRPPPGRPGVKVQPNPAPGRPGVKVQPNPAPGRPGVKVQPNPAPGRPGVKVLETHSTRPSMRPAQKTKIVLPLGAQTPARPVSTGTSNQWQATALSRAMQAAVAERIQKDSVPLADGQDGYSDNTKAILCRGSAVAGVRVLAVPQTVPRASRSTSQGWGLGGVKTPVRQGRAVPQTEGKKNMTAAQEDRMRKLQEWREARGISYKRPPMPVKPQARRPTGPPLPYWASMEQEEETQALVHAVDRSLDDCIALLLEGCPVSQIRGVLSRLPAVAHKFSKFWICQARLMEREGCLDVLPMFEEAVRVVLEPVDELRAVVFDILRKKDDVQAHTSERGVEDTGAPGQGLSPSQSPVDPVSTPKPVGALIHGAQGSSSVIKYKITATPGGFPSQQGEPARLDGHELRFFTPVRRSVRIERSSRRYPAALQDHDLCVTSYQDLVVREEKEREGEEREGGDDDCSPQMNPTMYVYRENDALRDQVHMQLVYDD